MKTTSVKKVFTQDTFYLVGILLVLCSAFFYLLGTLAHAEDAQLGFFFVNYLFTFGYWIAFFIAVLFFRKKHRFCRVFPALVLSLISAYSLNRVMNVFDLSPLWLAATLVVVSTASLTLIFYKEMNSLLRTLTLAVVGVGLIVFLYLALYLIPMYPISVAVFWILGISLHCLVPLAFVVFLLVWLYRFLGPNRRPLWGLATGIALVLIMVTTFSLRWAHVVSTMNETYRETFVEDEPMVPAWVRVAQRIPKNEVTNKALKVGLTYVMPDYDSWSFNRFPSRFTEQKIHNPFIVAACFFGGEPCMNNEEKIKILESMYDSRQQAAERLWSDDGVETSWVNSSILVWPQYRMAYTEQVIMIRNVHKNRHPSEAVYTFHLPEGSVVTSLSLWINGKEEKGILTTKNKADSAYRTIVGVESRDPSVIHWQEGATVNVRVFPITSDEERTLKIGITSPLQKQGAQLLYQPVYFEGTDFTKAKEKISVQFMQEPEKVDYPSCLKRNASGLETPKQQKYNTQWKIAMTDPGLSDNAFCFDGNTYRVQEIQTQKVPVVIQNIYLDLNRSWTKKDFNDLYEVVKDKNVWVYDGRKMVAVTLQNKDYVFDEMSRFHFSLFPVSLIKNSVQSLLVSKSIALSPNLSDLNDSPFVEQLKAHPQPVYFFNLGNELSPYLKTLREYRVLNYCSGNATDLAQLLQQSLFEQVVESDNEVAVHDAGICIVKQAGRDMANAPDHLMRLFAYNHIMLQYAQSWNTVSPLTDSMVAEAQQAYVVSPVSSLVVLESQADYDRFAINDSENSLKNASKSSKGAVPEPHEWALIALALGVAIFLYRKKYQTAIFKIK